MKATWNVWTVLCILLLLGLDVEAAGKKGKKGADRSLDQVLGVGKTEYRESSAETQQLWQGILKSLENNRLRIATERLTEFVETKDIVEPYQKTFANVALQILTGQASGETVTPRSTRKNDRISAKKQEIAELEEKIKIEENKRPALQKKIDARSVGGAAVGGLFDRVVGGNTGRQTANANTRAAQDELKEVERNIANHKRHIATLQQQIATIRQEGVEEANRRNQAAADEANAFRQKVVGSLNDMMRENHPRPVIALANLWVNKRGEDPEISKTAQRALDLQKTEAKAIEIANAATKPATDLMKQGRFWEAQAEIAKAIQLIGSRISDNVQLQFIQRDMGMTNSEIKAEIAKALKQLQTIHEMAQRDINEATKAFEAFRSRYPDYPDMEQAKMKLGDTRTAQVEAKTTKKIDAVERVIPNDPEEAKAMIKRLLESGVDPDEASILKAKLVKLNRDTLDRELELVRKDLDEAQSYLTKASASYASELKEGKKPTVSFSETFSSGMENIVRARSFQAGGVKRLEVLLGQEMDTVTKSRLVGLVETQKAALQQMDGLLEHRDQNKMIMLGGGAIGGLGLLIGFGAVAMRMKKNRR